MRVSELAQEIDQFVPARPAAPRLSRAQRVYRVIRPHMTREDARMLTVHLNKLSPAEFNRIHNFALSHIWAE